MGFVRRFPFVLPPILLTISFIFALHFVISKDFVHHSVYSNSATDTEKFFYLGEVHLSPFTFCDYDRQNKTIFKETCSSYPPAGTRICSAAVGWNDWLCQQVIWSGNLMVAGAVFTGLAMLGSFILLFLQWLAYEHGTGAEHKRNSQRIQAWVSFVTTVLFLLPAVICIILAQVIGINAFGNNLYPQGVFTSQSNVDDSQGVWVLGKAGAVWPSVAWFSAILGGIMTHVLWRVPVFNYW